MTDTEQFRAFRFALDPTDAQRQNLARHVGAARWAFNHALACKLAAHQEWRTQVAALTRSRCSGGRCSPCTSRSRFRPNEAIQFALNRSKGDDRADQDGLCPWWHEVSTYAFQSALADADSAWKNWLDSLSGREPAGESGIRGSRRRADPGIPFDSITT